MHVRYCPECDEEYRPEIVSCADCGGPLEDRDDEAPPPPSEPEPDPAAPPPGEYDGIFQSDRAADLEPLAERLGGAGIPFQVKASPRGFELQVRKEEREQALEHIKDLLPIPEEESILDREYSEQGRYPRCPGCAVELAASVSECPECGLMLGGPVTCRTCGSEFSAEELHCPGCGATV